MLPAMTGGGAIVLDPGSIYPEFAALRKGLADRDWPACRRVLGAAAPAARTELIRLGGEEPELTGFLREVLAADPADSGAAALLGCHLTAVAWRVRSRARAQFVGRERFEAFHAGLREAEQVLIEASARDPHDPAVWTCRMPTARGLELGHSEARRRYDRLAALDPHHLPGQMQLLQQLCPKWGGDWARLNAFARESMLAAPPGAPNAVLVVEAHLEHWLEVVGAGMEDGRQYLAGVHHQIVEAAQRSVRHPDFRRDVGWVRVVGTFAMAFSLLWDQQSAAPLFAMLGDFGSERPWDYLGDPAAVIAERRKIAGAVR
jgi:hypothetical protein